MLDSNPSPAKPSTTCRTSILRQALDWFWVSAAVGILFNSLHPAGIELKVSPRKPVSAVPALKASASSYPGWNIPSRRGAPAKTPASVKSRLSPIGLLGARKAFDEKSADFLDARKEEEYAAGHIPGAVNFYAEDFDRWAARVLPRLDPSKPYILYCTGSECELSNELADKLEQQGFKNLKVFFGGWPEWKKAGFPVKEGAQP
jgi:rhodanese-related sulfurtransferase